MKGNTPAYIIKPKYIFKSPFLKYDLQNPTNREAQNEELTEYFNYGFNEDTMNIYAKLVNRTLKVLDHKKNIEYFDEPSELMRLNDQIPMDFGGFCKFYDPTVFKNDFIKTDQQLFKNFLFNTFKATYVNGKQYPMLEFVKSMYRKKVPNGQNQQNQNQQEDNPLPSMIEQISKNLQKKYEQTMRKLIQQKNQPKQITQGNPAFRKGGKFQRGPRAGYQTKQKQEQKIKPEQRVRQKQVQPKVQQKKARQRQRKPSRSSSSGSSSSSSSSSSSNNDRKRRHKEKRSVAQKQRGKKRQRSRQKKSSKPSRKQSRHESRHQSKHGKMQKKSRRRSRSKDQKENRRRR